MSMPNKISGFFSFEGYFDEDSMDEFIASDSDETSMSLSSDDYAK